MDRPDACVEAQLVRCFDFGSRSSHASADVAEIGQIGIVRRSRLCQWMIWGHCHEGSSEQGVGPRGVDFQFGHAGRMRAIRQRPANQHAFRATDPVALHQLDLVRPAVKRVESVEQVLGIFGDLEEPLGQIALLNRSA